MYIPPIFSNRSRRTGLGSLDFTEPMPSGRRPLGEQLRIECEAMARYALRQGLGVPPEQLARVATLLSPADSAPAVAEYGELAALHRKLADAVAPATPQGITLLDQDRLRGQRWAWLGPVPLIRMLTLAAIFFQLGVLVTGLSDEVTVENVSLSWLDASGTSLLINMLFLLFCAGLGASFATLFQAHRYIANSSYDPKYDASYGARLILGVIAGLILVEMLPAELLSDAGMGSFGKPTLAMLGGFSATAVHRLLQRMVETLETLVRGDGSARIKHSIDMHKVHAASERTQSKHDLVAELLALQQSLDSDTPPEVVRQRLAELTRAMLSPQSGSAGTTAERKE
ncbi:hypothetical protein FNU76_19605 [Chitinimonas arctica]|uniref:Uncharacterized protein n=1 Tax=Chitinimonas arctica TaxID=2594795 RepID=A0A516SJR3_9NEIS|nr:hypothetical protein [Chitinimonas arctica]QDQ28380.1 hypothetical protein FNU76_19605 [Chitinimonas arctica]